MARAALPAGAVPVHYRPVTRPGEYIDPGLPSILPFDPAPGITLRSYEDNPGMAITLPTWKAFVDTMSMSRIYAGAHTRSANEAGEAIGREVARRALAGSCSPRHGGSDAAPRRCRRPRRALPLPVPSVRERPTDSRR
jgi:hypothetical protein